MKNGTIIYLNGVTSTGKTSIARAIQELADQNYYYLSHDIFQSLISRKHLQTDYWLYLSEAIICEYKTAKLLSESGINVIIDGMILDKEEFVAYHDKSHYDILKEIFYKSNIYMIEVFCPLEECKQRNIIRCDRYENQSQEQSMVMVKNVEYDYKVETHIYTAKECASSILKHIFLNNKE